MQLIPRRLFSFVEGMTDPFATPPPGTPPGRAMAFLVSNMRPFAGVMAIASVVGVLVAVLELGLIWYAGRLVDLMGAGPATLWRDHGQEIALAALVLLILRPIVVGANAAVLFSGISTNLLTQARWRAHHHLLGQPVAFFQSDFAGRLANRVLGVGPATEDTGFLVFEAFWQASAFAIATLILLTGMDWRIALPLALWILAFVGFVLWFAPKAGRAAEKLSHANSRVTARVVDSYTNIESVKLFAHAAREQGFAQTAMRRHNLRFGALMRLFANQQAVMAVFNSAAMGLVIGPALWVWTQGGLSVGQVAAAIAMALRLNTMTGWIMWMTVRTFEHMGTIRESLESIAVPQTVTDTAGSAPLAVRGGAIHIRGLVHHYDKGRGGLAGIDLDIAAGERIGVVGQSIASVTQDSLRAQIGMVTQDSSLLHRSVRDNILYGRPDATEEQMIAAARKAEAHDFIQGLVDTKGRRGYDALVGERGVRLSGGQRQRVALARVILKDAPILILDEATSALDSEVEAAIRDTLYGMMEGKTVIAIAHRLSTIAQMDRIVVLDHGLVAEAGSHSALLARNGLYARFWARQSGGLIGLDA